MNKSSKLIEADKNLKEAYKCLEKSLFKWQPDYLSAVPLFENAAEGYLFGGNTEKAKEVFLKATKIALKNGSSFKAAQYMQKIAKIFAEKDNDLLNAKKYYQKACDYYIEMGEITKGAETLRKGAIALENINPKESLDLHLKSCNMVESEKPYISLDFFNKALSCAVKNQFFNEALNILEKQINIFESLNQIENIHKTYLSIVIIYLTMGDIVAADKAYMKHLQKDSYLHANEAMLAEQLVMGFKNGDEELVLKTIKNQGFNYIDTQIGKLAKKLNIYGKNEINNLINPVKKSNKPIINEKKEMTSNMKDNKQSTTISKEKDHSHYVNNNHNEVIKQPTDSNDFSAEDFMEMNDELKTEKNKYDTQSLM